jgi:thermostable 8-oxoguanine DNA glycosylase
MTQTSTLSKLEQENTVVPTDITNYNRTDVELQTFWLFCVLVAGKNSDTTAKLVKKLLNNRGDMTPFEFIKSLKLVELHNYLVSHRVGQYDRIKKALFFSARLNLRTCTRDDLLEIHGVGPKTARFFLLHTREFCDEVVLDTHILRWMREKCGIKDAPKNTPQNPEKYAKFAGLCKYLIEQHFPGLSLAQADLMIWTVMSGRLADE